MVSKKEFRYFLDCKVQAWRMVVGPKGYGFNGGPIIQDDKYSMLRHCRFGSPFDTHEQNVEFDNFVRGTYNYIGPVYNHFGHIMSEMIHRILPSRRVFECDKWLAVANVSERSAGYEALPSVYREILEILGIRKDNIKILNADSVVERLNIAEQHSQFGLAPDVEYLEEISNYIDPILDKKFGRTNKKGRIYVSRSMIPVSGGFLGECYFQNILREYGFEIFHPQEHSVLQQLDTYRKSEIVIFSEGSACHGVELLGCNSLDRIMLLSRRSNHGDIFRRVLAPRARTYTPASVGVNVGAVVANRSTGRPLEVYEQSIFNVDTLVAVLQDFGVSIKDKFDRYSYYENVSSSFDNHIKNCLNLGFRTISYDDISRLRTKLMSLISGHHDE